MPPLRVELLGGFRVERIGAARPVVWQRRTARTLTKLLRHNYRGPDGRFAKPAPSGGGKGRGSAIAAEDREELAKSAREGIHEAP